MSIFVQNGKQGGSANSQWQIVVEYFCYFIIKEIFHSLNDKEDVNSWNGNNLLISLWNGCWMKTDYAMQKSMQKKWWWIFPEIYQIRRTEEKYATNLI